LGDNLQEKFEDITVNGKP